VGACHFLTRIFLECEAFVGVRGVRAGDESGLASAFHRTRARLNCVGSPPQFDSTGPVNCNKDARPKPPLGSWQALPSSA
jgi:hypothetical protein